MEVSTELDAAANAIIAVQPDINLDGQIIPLNYKLRLSFSDQNNSFDYLEDSQRISRWKAITSNLVDKILPYAYNSRVVGGLEFKNSSGEYTYAHCHIHFQSKNLKDTICKPLQRYLRETYDLTATGARYWCFKPDVVLRTEERFWRYPLKQGLNLRFCRGFDKANLERMYAIASSSYLDASQVSQAKKDKRDNSDTLFERVATYLDKEKIIALNTLKDVQIKIIQFYLTEDRPITKTTIIGYASLYMLKKGFLTPDALVDIW